MVIPSGGISASRRSSSLPPRRLTNVIVLGGRQRPLNLRPPKGARYFLRNFSATAVKEHLRSQIEDTGGSPDLTKNELELMRFIYEGSFDWRAFLAKRSGA